MSKFVEKNNSENVDLGKKVRYTLLIVIIGIIIGVIFLISNSYSQKEEIITNSKKYSELEQKKRELEDKYNSKTQENKELKQQSKQQEIQQKITLLENKEAELNSKVASLDSQIASKTEELEKIKGNIINEKGKFKTYPAGMYTIGKDILSGRYKVYGGSSNFTVYSASGNLKVNTILGNDSYSTPEYVCNLNSGDVINSRSAFNIIEIE